MFDSFPLDRIEQFKILCYQHLRQLLYVIFVNLLILFELNNKEAFSVCCIRRPLNPFEAKYQKY